MKLHIVFFIIHAALLIMMPILLLTSIPTHIGFSILSHATDGLIKAAKEIAALEARIATIIHTRQ